MIFAFVPIATFLLGVMDIVVPWKTLLPSIIFYVVIPLVAGFSTRKRLDKNYSYRLIERFSIKVKPFFIMSLLATIVLLLIQGYGIFVIAYGWAYFWRTPFDTASPARLIGTSNFFRIGCVAVAINLFGFNSGATLATVVGVLVEVPVMLPLVVF